MLLYLRRLTLASEVGVVELQAGLAVTSDDVASSVEIASTGFVLFTMSELKSIARCYERTQMVPVQPPPA